jgi:mRNA interferase HigB
LNVIAPKTIRAFIVLYPESELVLRTWYNDLRSEDFPHFAALREHFVVDVARGKDKGTLYIFDLAGNQYRVVCRINFENQTAFIRFVLTHKDYDEWNRQRRPE